MTFITRLGIVSLVLIIGLGLLEIGDRIAVPSMPSFVSEAHAVVGRPLTPVSVAGVSRRTSRRVARRRY